MVSTGPRIYPEMAPDGLWSTPSDLARYVIEVQGSLAGRKGSLLSASTAHAMLTAQLNPYGLGAIVGDDKLHPWFTHNGDNYGYPCLFVAYNQGEGAVVMADGNGYELNVAILRSMLKITTGLILNPSDITSRSLTLKRSLVMSACIGCRPIALPRS